MSVGFLYTSVFSVLPHLVITVPRNGLEPSCYDRRKCQAIQGFVQSIPNSNWTLSVDIEWLLFDALNGFINIIISLLQCQIQ